MAKYICLLLVVLTLPVSLFSQREGKVIISGRVIDAAHEKAINVVSIDPLERDFRKIISVPVDSLGKFKIVLAVKYTQEILLRYETPVKMLCSPGDSIYAEIGAGTVGFNDEIKMFLEGWAQQDTANPEAALDKTPADFKEYISRRESRQKIYLKTFNAGRHTSNGFQRWAGNHVQYETLYYLLQYWEKHYKLRSQQHDSMVAAAIQYDMDDREIISFRHRDFLQLYSRYIVNAGRDSLVKANALARENKLVEGAQILLRRIRQSTTGFTRDLFVTRFYLDAIEGQQLKEFEALYNAAYIQEPAFRQTIGDKYATLKNFLANRAVGEANIISLEDAGAQNILKNITAKFPNKVVYIDFWAPWCLPCMEAMPSSKEVQQFYKGKNVAFVFLANRCSDDSWKATISNNQLTGEHVLLTNEQYDKLAQRFKIAGIPHYILIDKKGAIFLENAPGPAEKQNLFRHIDKLLAE